MAVRIITTDDPEYQDDGTDRYYELDGNSDPIQDSNGRNKVYTLDSLTASIGALEAKRDAQAESLNARIDEYQTIKNQIEAL
jgi:hypothetical protein